MTGNLNKTSKVTVIKLTCDMALELQSIKILTHELFFLQDNSMQRYAKMLREYTFKGTIA